MKPLKQSFKRFKDKFCRVYCRQHSGQKTLLQEDEGNDLFLLYWVPNPNLLGLCEEDALTLVEQYEVSILNRLQLEVSKLFKHELDPIGMRNYLRI